MKRLAAFLLLLGLMSPAAVLASDMTWFSLKEGVKKARAEKKPMIVDFFFGKGCPRCEFLQEKVYSDPAVAGKIMTHFVPIRVDLTKKLTKEEEELGNRYDYKNDCLLLFLDPQANIIEEPVGKKLCFVDKVDPDEFVKYLDTLKARLGKEK
ncbi:MAG: thioredoxin family protein [Nitrospiraceae bacterium]|nr:thioredoxin family protein [Nitrospiraceae bacterium]